MGFQAVRYAALRIIIKKSSQNGDGNILIFSLKGLKQIVQELRPKVVI